VRCNAICCVRQARHQQAAAGTLGKLIAAGSKVHQHGSLQLLGAGPIRPGAAIAQSNCAPQRLQELIFFLFVASVPTGSATS
jgi:hypothetical protein